MSADARRAIAVISVHASPVSPLGRGENGGMNLAIRRICEGLSDRGVPTDVYVRRDSRRDPDEELIARQSRVIRLPVGAATRLPKDSVRFLCDEFADAVRRHARSEAREYRAIHGHYWLGGLVARVLRDSWRAPWVQSFHTLARTKARVGLPLDALRAHAEAEMVTLADRLVASSLSEAKDLIRLYGASRDSICIAQPGVDLRLLRSRSPALLRRRLHLEGKRVVLFAGRLEPLKGADTLLDAIAALSEDPAFADVRVLVVGDNSGDGGTEGGERRRLEERVKDTPIFERVSFLGAIPHEQLGEYYALADVCVVPSLTESFGLVALEAQAHGTPVVAAAVGGLTEIVEDEVTGLLVRGRDPRAYALALARLLRDADLRRRMGEEAQRRASRFTWTRAVDRLAAIYDRIGAQQQLGISPCGESEAEVPSLSAS
jgi:D-inositol-3-phosphate glycosyltransferase